MNTSDTIFQRALSKLLNEVFDGPPGSEAYLLNPGDPGLLRQLESIDARAASLRPMPGKTTIAAHVDHVHYGFPLMNRWAAGEPNPFAGANWEESWQHTTGLLPEKTDPIPVVPDWPQFMQGCVRYRQSLDEQVPSAPRTTEPYK